MGKEDTKYVHPDKRASQIREGKLQAENYKRDNGLPTKGTYHAEYDSEGKFIGFVEDELRVGG